MSDATRLSVAGLVVAAAGMLLQMSAGSTLYPSLAGPIVLLLTALLVVFGPARWTRYVALLIPLVLGLGALVAAAMTGDFIGQLTNMGNPGLVLGSWMHVAGLLAAVAGGVGMLAGARTPVGRGA
jgi:hypothetical protein